MHVDDGTPPEPKSGFASCDAPDPFELARVQALLESRMLGAVPSPPRLGRFILIERIGAGGMGVVYAAYDDKLDRKVAVKLLHAELHTTRVRERLVREAQAMAKLSHPNVAAVFEIGEHEGRGLVAMELVDGQTLRKWCSDRPRDAAEILAVYLQAARGLAAAHAAGIVHRDFKPDNALIDAEGRVRVLDFGLALHRGAEDGSPSAAESLRADVPSSSSSLTRTGTRIGTPAYMAAEQIRGEPTDARTDQYAFCVSLWEAFTGARPFGGRDTTELFDAVQRGDIVASRRRPASWIETILRRGLSPDPGARYPTMDALVRALEADPSRRRRRWAIFGTTTIALAAVWTTAAIRERMRVHACAREGDSIDEVWNAGAEQRVHEGLLASDAGNAAPTAERAAPRLAAYAERWREQAEGACLARADEPSTSDAREACLDRARVSVATMIDTLAEADRDAVQLAITATESLPRPEDCAEPRDEESEPTDPELRAGVRALRRELSAVYSLQLAGRYPAALARAESVLADAQALGWASTIAAAGYRVAINASQLGDDPRAVRHAEEAFYVAATAGLDAMAARAALLAYFTLGYRLQHAEEADRWERLASVFIARLDDPSSDLLLTHEAHVGAVSSTRGDLVGAKARLERALELGEASLGASHEENAHTLFTLAEVQTALGDYEDARASAARGEAIITETLGPEHPMNASPISALALAEQNRGNGVRAVELYRRALALRQRAFGPIHFDVATSHLNLGNGLAAVGELEEADRELVVALGIYEYLGHREASVVLALGNLANVRYASGDVLLARAFAARGLAMAEALFGPTHPEIGRLANAVGTAAEALGEYETAREHLQRALTIGEATFGPEDISVAEALSNLANVEVATGDTVAARDHYARALKIFERRTVPDDVRRSFALTGLGWTSTKLGDHAAARSYLQRALELRERGLPADHPMLAVAFMNLAEAESLGGDHMGAREQLRRGLAIYSAAAHPDQAWALAMAARIERDAGYPAVAVEYFEQALTAARAAGDDTNLAHASFGLAGLLVARRATRSRAIELAREAKVLFRARGTAGEGALGEVEAWLAHHAT